MSHITVTLIGSHDDLDWIYENCTTDSSSESSAEQAFGYDSLNEYWYPCEWTPRQIEEWLEKVQPYDKDYFRKQKVWWSKSTDWENPPIFTKNDIQWKYLLDGWFNEEDVLDLRPRKDWVNVGWDTKKKQHKTKEEIIEWFKTLPDDVTFFFADAHV